MADVQLTLDNGDGLLPVDFGVVELGRRLYRSGENDYLLNRSRVRLKDLIDLLDAGHLAENAFLFIGQGMVDQALALRPEERRPLFEEVAGVRRHERRRRRAEEQLAEAESNLARVEDILAELRPQARRLGELAEQQASRMTAGEELAAALVVAAHARWHEASGRLTAAESRQAGARSETDAALRELEEAEAMVSELAGSMAERADAERDRRAEHEAARAEVTSLALREARVAAELQAIARDKARLGGERDAAAADQAAQRRLLAEPVPDRDLELDASLAEADRALAEALSELGALRATSRAQGEELAAIRRAEGARAAEAETARRRAADATRRADEERAKAAAAAIRVTELEAAIGSAREALAAAIGAEATAVVTRDAARSRVDAAEGAARAAAERVAAAGAGLASAEGRLADLDRRIGEDEDRGIARAAMRLGGRRVDEDLGVDPRLRPAVEAALGDLARAYVVDASGAVALADQRGALVVRERLGEAAASRAGGGRGASGTAGLAATARLEEAIAAVGGGRLADAVRRDEGDVVRRLLERSTWVPDLDAALRLQADLPPGWIAVVRDGSAVLDATTVRLGRGDAPLERRAEAERLRRDVAGLRAEADAAGRDERAATGSATQARAALETARSAESEALAARRRAEQDERSAGRDLEAAAREAAWHAAQAERLGAEAARASGAVDGDVATGAADATRGEPGRVAAAATGPEQPGATEAIVTWERRAAELRSRRDRIAADVAAVDGRRRENEGRRARAEASVALAEARLAGADRELASLADRERATADERAAVTGDHAAASEREARAREALDGLLADDRAERARLAEAERQATAARERLRAADERARVADVAALEARLAMDGLREQLLVELAGLGDVGQRHLAGAAGLEPQPRTIDADDAGDRSDADDSSADAGDGALLELALDAIASRWAASPPDAEPPTPGRLAQLRRRFHELGAANPFAVDEYRAVRERLEALDSQDRDLRDAIARTRALIADLDGLIATQFRATFAALEVAFDARFRQLFGGGFARLTLTDPEDLASTGIEITARPPGKKPQTLAMLSGGERALTAVALLFAMLQVRPAPFCVLDEVDAALDEANVGRFTDALRDLAERTQFVVITHNRGTIAAADALYGVTVGDDSVSRVISLRLDEAQAIADRTRGQGRTVLAGEPA
jgi:chromosome segregation protein